MASSTNPNPNPNPDLNLDDQPLRRVWVERDEEVVELVRQLGRFSSIFAPGQPGGQDDLPTVWNRL